MTTVQCRFFNSPTVPIVMVLNPKDMHGHGPPFTKELPFDRHVPEAYAFIDLATCVDSFFHEGESEKRAPEQREIGVIVGLGLLPADRLFKISVADPGEEEDHPNRAGIFVDYSLDFKNAPRRSNEQMPDGFWEDRWHRIISNGQYVVAPREAVP